MNKPLKRHESLKPLSREHHHILLLCWKIREGFKKEVSPERMKAYASFFYETQLKPHFTFEEEKVFPLLNEQSPLRKQAINEHQHLVALFTGNYDPEKALQEIATSLEDHVRFEERVLFQEIQHQTEDSVLNNIETKKDASNTPNPDDWDDPFWKE